MKICVFAGIAWLIIPHEFRIEYGFFLFRSWNLFTIVCALPSLISACLLLKLPETPKFLLAKGRHDETVACLKYIYRWNNNNTDDKFAVSFNFLILLRYALRFRHTTSSPILPVSCYYFSA